MLRLLFEADVLRFEGKTWGAVIMCRSVGGWGQPTLLAVLSQPNLNFNFDLLQCLLTALQSSCLRQKSSNAPETDNINSSIKAEATLPTFGPHCLPAPVPGARKPPASPKAPHAFHQAL